MSLFKITYFDVKKIRGGRRRRERKKKREEGQLCLRHVMQIKLLWGVRGAKPPEFLGAFLHYQRIKNKKPKGGLASQSAHLDASCNFDM